LASTPPPTPEEIWDYYQTAQETFVAHYEKLKAEFPRATVERSSRFFAMSVPELDDTFERLGEELNCEVALALVGSIEAIFMSHYNSISAPGPHAGMLEARLWALRGRRGDDASFDDVLEAWKEARPGHGQEVGQFKQVLRFRHWLSHGRRWDPLGFAGFDVATVVDRARRLDRSLAPSLPRLVGW
jgi:hypothetical protein